ncbi:MAG TPA: hypothetical protein VGN17_01835 [Bryobacteraceae bacterium]|jgi:hypothetical protein
MPAQFRTIRINSRDEFDRLVEHMTQEAYRARDNWDFLIAMQKASKEYVIEVNQTPTFWRLTHRAHKDQLILRLARLFDPNPDATSLGNLLWTMKEDVDASTMFPPELAHLDRTELARDIDQVSKANPTVEKLLTIRNKYLAHRDKGHVSAGGFPSSLHLDEKELFRLMTLAVDLLRKYGERLPYRRPVSRQWDAQEFRKLLSLLRAGLNSKESRRAMNARRAGCLVDMRHQDSNNVLLALPLS